MNHHSLFVLVGGFFSAAGIAFAFALSTVFTEGPHMGDWLKGELRDVTDFCREAKTLGLGKRLLAGTVLSNGTVMGKITATGYFTEFDPSATDGSQTVAGILMYDVEISSASDHDTATILVRGPAAVVYDKLTWPSDIGGGRAAAEAALLALGIRGYVGA